MCWVQHLLGTGHLKRQLLIAGSAASKACPFMIVSGGPTGNFKIPQGVQFRQLAPLHSADVNFSTLIDGNGNKAGEDYWARRQAELRQHTIDFRPDIIITEMFPFGRRKFRHEIVEWLDDTERRHPDIKIVSSVRDILVKPKKTERVVQTANTLNERYDLVLVHSDPDVQPLSDSFPLTKQIQSKLAYTGFVTTSSATFGASTYTGVTISVGGGRVGRELVDLAIKCRANGLLADQPWQIIVGSQSSDDDFERWNLAAADNVKIEKFRHDLPQLIAASAVSVSQAGYNTVLETLVAGTPMVLVPFETETEDEQLKRATNIERLGRARVVRASQLNEANLAMAIKDAFALPRKQLEIDLNGAAQSIELLCHLHGQKT